MTLIDEIIKLRQSFIWENNKSPNCIILSHDMLDKVIYDTKEYMEYYDYIDLLERKFLGCDIFEVDGENIIKVGFIQ